MSLSSSGTRRFEATFRAHNRRETDWAHLLADDEVKELNRLLTKLADAAQGQDWVSRRS